MREALDHEVNIACLGIEEGGVAAVDVMMGVVVESVADNNVW